jgi:hypothetical protein
MVVAVVRLYGNRTFYEDEPTKTKFRYGQVTPITKQRTMMSRGLRHLLIENLLLVVGGTFEFNTDVNYVQITKGTGNTNLITETPL